MKSEQNIAKNNKNSSAKKKNTQNTFVILDLARRERGSHFQPEAELFFTTFRSSSLGSGSAGRKQKPRVELFGGKKYLEAKKERTNPAATMESIYGTNKNKYLQSLTAGSDFYRCPSTIRPMVSFPYGSVVGIKQNCEYFMELFGGNFEAEGKTS